MTRMTREEFNKHLRLLHQAATSYLGDGAFVWVSWPDGEAVRYQVGRRTVILGIGSTFREALRNAKDAIAVDGPRPAAAPLRTLSHSRAA